MASLLPLAVSTYGLYLSYGNITRLRQYEAMSEKAAEWSNTAAERLRRTRTTQTSGTVALLLSLLTSTTLLLPLPLLSTPTSRIAAAALNAVLVYGARIHMAAFWNEREQTRIPFVEKFNDAVRGSEAVVGVLGGLSVGWGVVGVWEVVAGLMRG